MRLLSLLSSVQWDQQHRRILDMRYAGTGAWVLTKDVFEQWKSGTDQYGCLWCYGIRKIVQPKVPALHHQTYADRESTDSWLWEDYSCVSIRSIVQSVDLTGTVELV